MRVRNFAAALGALVLFLAIGCILDNRQAGRGSEVENELGVYGILVDGSGKPVQGARVKALPTAFPADTDSVITDARGHYIFDSLPSGSYNLLGEYGSGSLVVLIPDVDVGDSGRDLGIDTLRLPGSIQGRFLAGTQGKAGILAAVVGLSRLELSDDSGRFRINGIPQGRYTLRYSGPGFLIPDDSGVAVDAGKVTELPDKHLEYDPALSPPEPTGLKAVYDTLNEKVILTWEAVPVDDLDGFIVYRDDPTSLDPQVVQGGFTKTHVFIDSSFSGASEPGGRILVYRVRSRDLKLNKSLNFSDPVEVHAVSKALVTTSMSIGISGLRNGAASPGDGLGFLFSYSNPTRDIRRIEWFKEGAIEPFRVMLPEKTRGADTVSWKTGGSGTEYLLILVTDEAGDVWKTGTSISVIEDEPRADAGADLRVSIGDSVSLIGKAEDAYGFPVRWEWSIGGSPFAISESGATGFQAPLVAGVIPCVLRVTDDDGMVGKDTLLVSVLEDPPRISAGADTVVSLGDAIRLRATGTDTFGRITKWEWSIGGKSFVVVPDGAISFQAPTLPGPLPCVLRVTDDDGNQVFDSLHVNVVEDKPSVFAGRDTTVSLGDSVLLHPVAEDKFGKILGWGWDIGSSGTYLPTSRGDTVVIAPRSAGRFPCVLKVVDDDGATSEDTLIVNVLADPPVARISAHQGPAAFVTDTVAFSASGSHDGFGKVVKWQWKAGDSDFVASADSTFGAILPSTPEASLQVVLKVTDDDGQSGSDTLRIAVLPRGGSAWIRASATPPFGSPEGFSAVPMTGRMWVVGNRFGGTGIEAWSSPEGVAWVRETGQGPNLRAPVSIGVDQSILSIGKSESRDTMEAWILEPGTGWSKLADLGGIKPRSGFALAYHNGRVFLAGGHDLQAGYLPDVWSSPDGIAWRQESSSMGAGRANFSLVSFRGKLWALGGSLAGADPLVLSSPDGIAWAGNGSGQGFPARYGTGAVVSGSALYVIAGAGAPFTGHWSDVWVTADGENWKMAVDKSAFGDRAFHAACEYGGKLWIVGGMAPTLQGQAGVWFSK